VDDDAGLGAGRQPIQAELQPRNTINCAMIAPTGRVISFAIAAYPVSANLPLSFGRNDDLEYVRADGDGTCGMAARHREYAAKCMAVAEGLQAETETLSLARHGASLARPR
jgi:hypothetical protein